MFKQQHEKCIIFVIQIYRRKKNVIFQTLEKTNLFGYIWFAQIKKMFSNVQKFVNRSYNCMKNRSNTNCFFPTNLYHKYYIFFVLLFKQYEKYIIFVIQCYRRKKFDISNDKEKKCIRLRLVRPSRGDDNKTGLVVVVAKLPRPAISGIQTLWRIAKIPM